jgi:hypothetical protein
MYRLCSDIVRGRVREKTLGVDGRTDHRKGGLGFDERLIAEGVDVAGVAWLAGSGEGRTARNPAVHGRDVGSR